MPRVGCGRADITPEPGLPMVSMPDSPRGEGVQWQLRTRVFLVEDAERRIAVVCLDLIALVAGHVAELGNGLRARAGWIPRTSSGSRPPGPASRCRAGDVSATEQWGWDRRRAIRRSSCSRTRKTHCAAAAALPRHGASRACRRPWQPQFRVMSARPHPTRGIRASPPGVLVRCKPRGDPQRSTLSCRCCRSRNQQVTGPTEDRVRAMPAAGLLAAGDESASGRCQCDLRLDSRQRGAERRGYRRRSPDAGCPGDRGRSGRGHEIAPDRGCPLPASRRMPDPCGIVAPSMAMSASANRVTNCTVAGAAQHLLDHDRDALGMIAQSLQLGRIAQQGQRAIGDQVDVVS